MQNLSISAELAYCLRSECSNLAEDMSQYSLIQVMEAHQRVKRLLSPKYTVGNVVANIRQLEDISGTTIMPSMLSIKFYSIFFKYLISKELSPNTIQTYFQQIVSSVTFATAFGCRPNQTYKMYPRTHYTPKTICITSDMVSHIYHFDISSLPCRPQKKRSLEMVRDMFCLQCCIGQRHSDARRVNQSMFSESRGVMQLTQQKTEALATVYIDKFAVDNKMVNAILEKYNYQAPYTASNDAYNRHLHDLLRYIGGEFNEPVHFEYKVDGMVRSYDKPLWQCISSHGARRFFVTYNRLIRKYTAEEVKQATGHKNTDMLDRYTIYAA